MGTVHLINAEGNTPGFLGFGDLVASIFARTAKSLGGDAASNPWIEDSVRIHMSCPLSFDLLFNLSDGAFARAVCKMCWESEDSKINLASQARAYWGSACNPQGAECFYRSCEVVWGLGCSVQGAGSWVYGSFHCLLWAGGYSQEDYLDVPLLNRRLQYTTDLSGAGCGCPLPAAFFR